MLSSKQTEYLQNCNHRWNIKTGATRSGKTTVDYMVTIPQRIMAAKGEGLLVMIGNTLGTLERNVLVPMRDAWGETLVGPARTSPTGTTAQIFGRTVYLLGADNKKHIVKLQGSGIEWCYGDEVTTWSPGVFDMLKSRLSCEHSHFDGTCNPDSPYHWLKDFLDSDADIYCQPYTIDDNPFLSVDFVENLKREYFGTVYYNRFILGQWALAEGLVYGFFADNPKSYILSQPTAGMQGRFFISIDYGTHNPCSMGLWCVQDGRAVRIKESYYDSRKTGRQRTTEEDYTALEELASGYYVEKVIVDPAAAAFIETIRRHGRFRVEGAVNDVLEGIRTTATLLQAGKILIHESCVDSIREFGSYSWDDRAQADKVLKEHDHAMDDIRYFAYTILARQFRWADWRPKDV